MQGELIQVKSVHFTNSWHSSSGGVSTFYRAMLKAAGRLRRSMALVVPAEADGTERWSDYATIHFVSSPESPFDRNYRCIPPRAYLRRGSRIAGILNGESPDLIEVCDKYTLPYLGGLMRLGKLPGVKARATVVGLSCERFDESVEAYAASNRLSLTLARLFMKSIYFPLSDHHIAVTMHTGSELERASRGHKVQRAVWIAPMGVDAETFQPSRRSGAVRREIGRRWGVPGEARWLLYAGRLAPEKNLPLLLSAMRQVMACGERECHLLVAGSGPLMGWMEEQAQAFEGRVHLLGHIEGREQLADLFANCDAFVHPNPREPFGIAPLEAMASGLPLVCPDAGGVRAYAGPHVAWMVPPETEAFARAMREAVTESAERCAKIQAARVVAEQHGWPAVCERYFQLYDEIHALCSSGRRPTICPHFYSTAGNWLGMERTAASAKGSG